MAKVIMSRSYNGTDFYYNQWTGDFVQSDKVDLSNLNYHCNKDDIPFADDIAIQFGLDKPELKELADDFTIK